VYVGVLGAEVLAIDQLRGGRAGGRSRDKREVGCSTRTKNNLDLKLISPSPRVIGSSSPLIHSRHGAKAIDGLQNPGFLFIVEPKSVWESRDEVNPPCPLLYLSLIKLGTPNHILKW